MILNLLIPRKANVRLPMNLVTLFLVISKSDMVNLEPEATSVFLVPLVLVDTLDSQENVALEVKEVSKAQKVTQEHKELLVLEVGKVILVTKEPEVKKDQEVTKDIVVTKEPLVQKVSVVTKVTEVSKVSQVTVVPEEKEVLVEPEVFVVIVVSEV